MEIIPWKLEWDEGVPTIVGAVLRVYDRYGAPFYFLMGTDDFAHPVEGKRL